MSNKYGFIYVWRDRKHNKFYLGCHWGTETDGYVCSSKHMRKAYVRRKEDFKRRVIQRVYTTRAELLEAEYNWLQLISDDELGVKYYNYGKHRFGHWSTEEELRAAIAEKTASKNRGRKASAETRAKQSASLKGKNVGKVRTPEMRQHMSEVKKGAVLTEEHKAKISAGLLNQPSEAIERRAAALRGKARSDETREKISKGLTGIKRSEETRAKLSEVQRGRRGVPKSESWKAKMANRIWINDGTNNRRVDPTSVPNGWLFGRA